MGALLKMKSITKRFSHNIVLDKVDFCAYRGQVHGIVGENGAGKTTLMNILAGLYPSDGGEIILKGSKVSISNPKQAQDLGIAMIHQDMKLFPHLDLAENIYIGREPLKRKRGLRAIDWNRIYKKTQEYLDYFGLELNPHAPINSLSIGQQKFVEIIKAISQDADIIIMDEPTAALTEQEIETLFRVIGDIRGLGVAIIFISHRIEEVKKIADAVTILRDGQVIKTCSIDVIDTDEMVSAMVGRELKNRYPKLKIEPGETILEVKDLSFDARLWDINFNVRKGEIFGITGLSGSGRRTLAKVLFGIEGPFEGEVILNGVKLLNIRPEIAMDNRLSYITGIGTEEGLINNTSICHNITITNLKRVSKARILNKSEEVRQSRDLIDKLEISASEKEIVDKLSGGRQKKVIFAKWLFNNGKIIIIDEPTAGIDIGSKVDIYNIINELALSGAAIIMISSDLPEVLGMCDRIAVMYNGRIPKIFNREEATQEKIIHIASSGGEK